jgi:bacillithiol biosynthesis deacetylase BshB1
VRAAVEEFGERLRMENRKLDVIAVGAHPDDVEIACGGTVAALAAQGYRVGIIDLTDGEPTPRCPDVQTRLAEAAAAARVLNVAERVTLNLPNRRLMDSFEARVALAAEFRRFRPEVVIGFGDKTPTASPDHWQAVQITDAAVFYSRLTKWDEHFQGFAPHSIDHQLYFRLSFEASPLSWGMNQITVDISHTLAAKLDAIRCYQTQFPSEKGHVFARVEALARVTGGAAGFAAGESFSLVRPVGTRDLVQTLRVRASG